MAEHGRLRLPLFTSLRGYDAGWLRGDVIAGLTVWAVLMPEGPTSATAALSAAAVADVATQGSAGFAAHTAARPSPPASWPWPAGCCASASWPASSPSRCSRASSSGSP